MITGFFNRPKSGISRLPCSPQSKEDFLHSADCSCFGTRQCSQETSCYCGWRCWWWSTYNSCTQQVRTNIYCFLVALKNSFKSLTEHPDGMPNWNYIWKKVLNQISVQTRLGRLYVNICFLIIKDLTCSLIALPWLSSAKKETVLQSN